MKLLPSRAHLQLLVSCCNVDGGLFSIEVRGPDVKVTRALDLSCTGLGVAWGWERVYVGYANGVRVLDRQLRPVSGEDLEIPGSDVHDVKPLADETLAVVQTSNNLIAAYQRDGTESWRWLPFEGSGDRCHLNSLVQGFGTLLSSMFTPEGLGEPWKDRLDGAIMEMPVNRDRVGGRILRRGIQQPHSMVQAEGSLWLCESRRRRVLRLSQPDSVPEVVVEVPGYTRGLCVTDEWIVVGQSRSDAHFVRPLVGEDVPTASACGIWLIPRHLEGRRFVDLPAAEVYDVVMLPRR